MYSPSDFNDDVSVFKDSQDAPYGNYCSAPVEPQYIAEPDHESYTEGRAPLNTLPAQWWNWLLNQITKKLNGVNKYVGNVFTELSNLLGLMGITPSEPSVPTGNQLSTGFLNNYPNVISKFLHTIASIWSYTGTTVVGDVTTTQTTKLPVCEHINVSDASTTPATETDTYTTKYVEQLPVKLGGTGGSTAEGAMINLVSPLSKIASNTGLLTDMVVFDRINSNSSHTVAKMDLVELGRLISSSNVNVPIITTNSTVITATALTTSESFGVMFTGNIDGPNASTPLQLTYNSTLIPVKAMKDGSLVDVYAKQITDGGTVVYRYLQKYTTLNLVYDGANFIIIGNPVVLSSSDYDVYANGLYKWHSYSTTERWTGRFWTDGKPIYSKYYDFGSGVSLTSLNNTDLSVYGINSVGTIVYFDLLLLSTYSERAWLLTVTDTRAAWFNDDFSKLFTNSSGGTFNTVLLLKCEYTKTTDSTGDIPVFSA